MFRRIVREGLELRPYEENDRAQMYAVLDANRAHIAEFLPWIHYNTEPDDMLPFVRRAREGFAKGETWNAGIWEHGQYIGGIGTHLLAKSHRNCSIGYWLSQEAQGRGIMTACCTSLFDFLFGEIHLHRVWLEAATDNGRSRAVAERLGMTHEGAFRRSLNNNGQWLDMAVYGILDREWEAHRRV